MKNEFIEKAKEVRTIEGRLNRLRESLHHLILQETDRKGGFVQLCFVGGTALRILHGLDRFSEDLDFSTTERLEKPFELVPLVQSVQKSLTAFGFNCEVKKPKSKLGVNGCFFAFGDLLHEMDRTFREGQKLLIKFEVDTNPPKGAKEETSPITGERLYKVRHYDLPSLFAGKLNAVLCRLYTKGRDLYDFLWYVGRSIIANKTLLENGYEQTQKKRLVFDTKALRLHLQDKFEKTDFENAKKDVAPFLVDAHALSLFEKEFFLEAVSKVKIA